MPVSIRARQMRCRWGGTEEWRCGVKRRRHRRHGGRTVVQGWRPGEGQFRLLPCRHQWHPRAVCVCEGWAARRDRLATEFCWSQGSLFVASWKLHKAQRLRAQRRPAC